MPKNRVPNCVLNRMILKFNPDMVSRKLGVLFVFHRKVNERNKYISIYITFFKGFSFETIYLNLWIDNKYQMHIVVDKFFS